MAPLFKGLLSMIMVVALSGCATTGATTKQEKRQALMEMEREVLRDLYKVRPAARAQVAKAPGYAVFSNANINVLLASFSGGQGVVKDNKTGKNVYMNMGEIGVGFGLGVKDFRAVFVFHERGVMNRFVDSGWEFGAHADAAAKAGKKGGGRLAARLYWTV